MSIARGSWFFHLFFISLIVFFLILIYLNWFTDKIAKNIRKNYPKFENSLMSWMMGNPDEESYIWISKLVPIVILIAFVVLYVSILVWGN
jgi:UDP-N-acetylmuramyl pentapeptide phosphotransferase/UDP-N-acetylglucosamine-1-phosphate transferase